MKELIGVTITRLLVSDDKQYLKIETDKDSIYYGAEGDCCSNSWIESIEAPEMPQTIVAVDEGDGVELKGVCNNEGYEPDLLQQYKTVLRCAKGESIHIEYRNSSNGYYGGYLIRIQHVPAATKWMGINVH